MTANQSTAADSEATVLTLRQVAKAALTVLSQQTQTLQQLLSQPQGLDLEFSKFVLDSRQLAGKQESAAPAAFVLLKSHTQPIEKSQQYAKAASTQAAFILTETEPEAL
ncbi:MAG TPA: UDP-N-acetylmuramoyl-L-alanyl-D-glutamate--2,6-diaminopimelate ligase, partial [Psychrobacter sp.]|nr:UDP-N-acetylmuramoyl-L-alanyl-D-glutamate--2,6-diaminopimelate ligase [Psychrobacter sp.]